MNFGDWYFSKEARYKKWKKREARKMVVQNLFTYGVSVSLYIGLIVLAEMPKNIC